MHFYILIDAPESVVDGGQNRYHATLGSAHDAIRGIPRGFERDAVRIELADISIEKANLVRVLNNQGGFQGPVLRTWKLGSRGGLVECANGE